MVAVRGGASLFVAHDLLSRIRRDLESRLRPKVKFYFEGLLLQGENLFKLCLLMY